MFVKTKEFSALCDLTDPLQTNVDKGLSVGKMRQGWRMLKINYHEEFQKNKEEIYLDIFITIFL